MAARCVSLAIAKAQASDVGRNAHPLELELPVRKRAIGNTLEINSIRRGKQKSSRQAKHGQDRRRGRNKSRDRTGTEETFADLMRKSRLVSLAI
jgi:hypothetical protein